MVHLYTHVQIKNPWGKDGISDREKNKTPSAQYLPLNLQGAIGILFRDLRIDAMKLAQTAALCL